MAKNNGDEAENGSEAHRSRSIIYDAQRACLEWQSVCLGTHQGYSQIDRELSVRGFHNAVIEYWGVLKPYRRENSIKDEWGSGDELELAPFWVGNVRVDSLDDVGRLRYATRVEKDVERDPVAGSRVVTSKNPAYLTPEQASDVFDTLQDMAESLGFLAPATKSTPQTEISRELIDDVNEWWKKTVEQTGGPT